MAVESTSRSRWVLPGVVGAVVAVRNAPSPAATSALAIAEHIVDRALDG